MGSLQNYFIGILGIVVLTFLSIGIYTSGSAATNTTITSAKLNEIQIKMNATMIQMVNNQTVQLKQAVDANKTNYQLASIYDIPSAVNNLWGAFKLLFNLVDFIPTILSAIFDFFAILNIPSYIFYAIGGIISIVILFAIINILQSRTPS